MGEANRRKSVWNIRSSLPLVSLLKVVLVEEGLQFSWIYFIPRPPQRSAGIGYYLLGHFISLRRRKFISLRRRKPSRPNTERERKIAWGSRDLIQLEVLIEAGRENRLFNRGPWKAGVQGRVGGNTYPDHWWGFREKSEGPRVWPERCEDGV